MDDFKACPSTFWHKEDIIDVIKEKYPVLLKYIKCESNYDQYACNVEFGCNAGMGLIQVIPGSLTFCKKELQRDLDPFNVLDNLDCGMILLKYQGEIAWQSSESCWLK